MALMGARRRLACKILDRCAHFHFFSWDRYWFPVSAAPTLDFSTKPCRRKRAASTPETFTQTRGLSSNRLDIPRLMATFPSGAKIYLLSPQENAVVASPWVDVVGTAPAETVITFNEEITVAGADGFFRARVPLEEGPNEIQCLASDLEGNEVDFSLIVVFDPEG